MVNSYKYFFSTLSIFFCFSSKPGRYSALVEYKKECITYHAILTNELSLLYAKSHSRLMLEQELAVVSTNK